MATTLLQALPYPASSAAANVPADIQALGVAVESKVVQVYTSSGARTSAFSAASLSPAAGMLSYLTGTKRFEGFDGTQWAPLPGQMVGFHERFSSVTYTGTEVGVIRVNAPMLAGYRYLILSSSLRISTVSGETGKANLRFSTTANAMTLDLALTSVEANANTAFAPAQSPTISTVYAPGTNVTFSCALTLTRSGGSGNVTMTGSTVQPISIGIYSAGPDPGNTGVDL